MDNPNLEFSPTDLPHLPLLLLDNFDLIPSMGVALRSFTASIISAFSFFFMNFSFLKHQKMVMYGSEIHLEEKKKVQQTQDGQMTQLII